MADDKFELRLSRDLPRGYAAKPLAGGGERGLAARWLMPEEMSGERWEHEGALLLGRREGRLIGWNDDRHVMTIAGSRAGKGVSLIIPNLLLYEGSAVVIDPKGENAFYTADHRGKGFGGRKGLGQDVHVIDPFGVSGKPSASFNPLAELDLKSDSAAEDAAMFAEALIVHPEDGERHWTESAQALLRALILVAARDPDPKRRNLVTVRRLLMLTDKRIRDVQYRAITEDKVELTPQQALMMLLRLQKRKRFGHICVGIAEQIEGMGEKERGSVLSAAKTQTQWLDDPRMKAVLWRSDFCMADLKRKKTTVYLCLPAMRMATHARWLRLMILHALAVMEETEGTPPAPVLFLLDEFPVLGHIQAIETAAGLMAGFGVKLWVILQNVGQLKRSYAKTWETFIANSGTMTAFGVSDPETLAILSKKIGQLRMVEEVSTGTVGSQLVAGAPAFREDHYEAPLLAEDELGWFLAREENRVLILGAGKRPAVAERVVYHSDPLFERLYPEQRKG
jgi:type IV secretion system protein VirD4